MTPITLVSMAPSGETFITRHRRGRLWLHKPEGAGGGGPVDEGTAGLAAAKYGFDRIEQSFESWDALDEFRLARAALVTPAVVVDRDGLDLDDVRELLEISRQWVAEGEGERAQRLALQLLRVPAVLRDTGTHEAVVSFLEELGRLRLLPWRPPASDRHAKAREVWQQLIAA